MHRLVRKITPRVAAAAALFLLAAPGAVAAEQKTLRVLFIGNSYTARHSLSQVVKAMAEAGDPHLRFEVATVNYGGRTLRFVNDAHLNQIMAYLTACTFYAAMFNRSPERLPVDSITDTRFLDDAHKDQDRDGGPLRRIFSARERADLQRLAWEGLEEFRQCTGSPGKADKR